MGPQFVHLQTFSRKPNPCGQSTEQVFGELIREKQYSFHVSSPKRPGIVDGISPNDLIMCHREMIQNAKQEVTGKIKTHVRSIRRDRHTLLTAIASYPLKWNQIVREKKELQLLRNWEIQNVKFFKQYFGNSYKATYRHVDEEYPHLHIYALPELIPGIDATFLHPGKRRKKEFESQARAKGISPRECVKIGNRKLKEAMREFQDLYFERVGEPTGLMRLGPQRQRLSRRDYMLQKHTAGLRNRSRLEAQRAFQEERARTLKTQEQKLINLGDEMKTSITLREKQLQDKSKIIGFMVNELYMLCNEIGAVVGLEKFHDILDGISTLERKCLDLKVDPARDALNSGTPDHI